MKLYDDEPIGPFWESLANIVRWSGLLIVISVVYWAVISGLIVLLR